MFGWLWKLFGWDGGSGELPPTFPGRHVIIVPLRATGGQLNDRAGVRFVAERQTKPQVAARDLGGPAKTRALGGEFNER